VDGNWYIGSVIYIKETLTRTLGIVKKATLGYQDVPLLSSYKPEVDKMELLDSEEHRNFQQQIGIMQWLVTIGRLDLTFAASSLSCVSVAPRKDHLRAAEGIFRYLNKYPEKRTRIDPSPQWERDLSSHLLRKHQTGH
jgi:hypothetical protein